MENLNQKYSIAFIPDHLTISLIKSYKDFLASKIGSYKSKNSMAHITIKEFFATDKELEFTINQLKRCCQSFDSVQVQCLNFNSYETNKTIFIEPDLNSKQNLIPLMKKIQKNTTLKSNHFSSDPHISIGRGIIKFEEALAVLNFPLNIHFEINSVYIRKFNPNIKQYEIYKTIPFLGLPNEDEIQLSLF